MADIIFTAIFARVIVTTNYTRLVTGALINSNLSPNGGQKRIDIFIGIDVLPTNFRALKKNTVYKIESVEEKSTTFNRI